MKYYTKKWYLNGCIDKPIIEDENYYDYDTDIHDAKIIQCESKNDYLTIYLETGDIWNSYSKIVFCDYKILEGINLIGAVCIADEIYVRNDYIEYHLLIWSENIQDYNNLGYFIIQAKKVLFYDDSKDTVKKPLSTGSFIEA